MLRRIASAAVRVGRSQLLGLGAQVLGAAPVIAMSIYLSHALGLSAVADYAMLTGASAVAFTLGMIGLRSRLVIDRFRSFNEGDYYTLRIAGSLGMSLGIFCWGMALGAPVMLTLAVVLMRAGDAALDLVMALDQVRREDRAHMYGYIRGSAIKLALLVVALAAREATGLLTPYAAFALASGLHVLTAWMQFLRRRKETTPLLHGGRPGSVARLLRQSVVFAMAQIICAVLTSSPRIALPALTDRDMAGSVGAALSVATLVGMTYFAVWLRWVPRFGKDGLQPLRALLFMAEMVVALAMILTCLALLGRPAMALVYGIETSAYLDMTNATLMACALFFFVMTLANLFKPTRLPWAESATYVGGLAALWMAQMALPGVTSIPVLVLAGTAGMSLLGLLSFAVLFLTRRTHPKFAE